MPQLYLFSVPAGGTAVVTPSAPEYFYLPSWAKRKPPELVPFGKFQGKSIEQLALADYKYFLWYLEKVGKPTAKVRFKAVHHVLNNFVSKKNCECCEQPARYMSVINEPMMGRFANSNFIYCSRDCFDRDPNASHQKTELTFLTADNAYSSTKIETRDLMSVIRTCLDLDKKRLTKETLATAIDEMPLWKPFEG